MSREERPGEQLDFRFDLPDGPAGPEASPGLSGIPGAVPPRPPRSPRPEPFNYSAALERVIQDLVGTLEPLRHIDLGRVLVCVTQARQASRHGVYASCVPLRFEGGSREVTVRKQLYRMPSLEHEGREILYLLYFMLPRFHEEQDYREKLATIIHELYHISPHFNGDIRRFSGKNYAHGHSREVYHSAMRALADEYLASGPRAHAHEFLRVSFSELLARPGGVVGRAVARPRAVLVSENTPETGRPGPR